MRQTGVLFSLDGLLCIIMVIVMAGAIVQQGLATEEKSGAFAGLNDKAFDRAMTDMYRNIASAQTLGGTAEFGKCVEIYYYNLVGNPLNAPAVATAQSFCEEA